MVDAKIPQNSRVIDFKRGAHVDIPQQVATILLYFFCVFLETTFSKVTYEIFPKLFVRLISNLVRIYLMVLSKM